ncbi:bifunctional hydroxyacyl-CoA dehydrogenase/enoyl-CoA hydratase fox2 [Entomophthora muscae]|uniref:Bifunctional hydroxyacyl-CoA dehydrogenase/enoyl-CoA hydratase fox2 n=1 Tax=Entomophthora muscae TaxID=34485 RepID=A0ACC2TYD5_9FUNG|nr:bifunctional hydroxyacyl-CoA dehydrogenase/enoyl-CoA hydratase fox2 [Entomophthora muscae]
MDEGVFRGLVVVIVNGGCNIGRSIALEYAARKAKVVVHGQKHAVDIISQEIKSQGGKSISAYTDPMDAALDKYRFIDIVVIVTQQGTLGETFGDTMHRMAHQTYLHAVDGHARFAKQGRGSILVVVDDETSGEAHVTSRMTIMGLCKSLASKRKGITCNCLLPKGKQAEKRAALLALALTSPSSRHSGGVVEVTRKGANQLSSDESITYTYASSSPSIDEMLQQCLAEPASSTIQDKVAIVTGAGGGLGLMVARRLLELGAYVVAYESNMMLREVPQLGAGQFTFKRRRSWKDTILSRPEPEKKPCEERHLFINSMEEKEMVQACINKFGRIDVLINCASVPTVPSRQDLRLFNWELMIRHHIEASYRMSQHVWPLMSLKKKGHIVNMIPMDQARACALSLGMAGLSQALARKGEKDNIVVNCTFSSHISSNQAQIAVSLPILLAMDTCPFRGATLEASSNQATILDLVPSNLVEFSSLSTVKHLIGALDCNTLVPPTPIPSPPYSPKSTRFTIVQMLPLT